MSSDGIEKALYKIHSDPIYLKRFMDSPDVVLEACSISDAEFLDLKNWNVKALAKRDVSQMLIMITWQAVHGFENTPDYIRKMNE